MIRGIASRLFGARGGEGYVVDEMLIWPELSEELRDMRASFATEKPNLIDMFADDMCQTLRDTMAQPEGQPDHMSPRLSGAVGLWLLLGGHMPRPCPFAGLALMGRLMDDEDFARGMDAAEREYRSDPVRFASHAAQETLFFEHASGHALARCGTAEHLAWWHRYVILDMPVRMTDDQDEYERLYREKMAAIRAFDDGRKHG
jgi:hypothetical protein